MDEINKNNDIDIEEKIDAEKKKPRIKKKTIIIAEIVVLVIMASGFVWSLYRVNWSFDEYKRLITKGHLSCFIKHDFKKPDCENGYVCKKCGYKKGEPLGHKFTDATCTEPSICSVCGEVLGEPLGHTTEMGVCKRCGEPIYTLSDEMDEINECLDNVTVCMGAGVEYVGTMDNRGDDYEAQLRLAYAREEFKSARSSLKEAIRVCKGHKDLSKMKAGFENMDDYLRDIIKRTKKKPHGVKEIYESFVLIIEESQIVSKKQLKIYEKVKKKLDKMADAS